MEGYGIFWALVEILRNQQNFRYPVKSALLKYRQWNTSTDKIAQVIKGYELFVIENDEFISVSLLKRMELKVAKSNHMRQLALKRWGKDNDPNADVMRTHSEGNAIKKKESKFKKNKEEESEQWNAKIEDNFNQAVNLYEKKTHLVDAIGQWSALTQTEIFNLIDHIPKFIENHKQNGKIKYLPRFSEYLRLKRWNEDLPYENPEFEDALTKLEQNEIK
jgi:hypothetical protein